MLCLGLNVVKLRNLDAWCATIALSTRNRAAVYEELWSDEFAYVCQYHCK